MRACVCVCVCVRAGVCVCACGCVCLIVFFSHVAKLYKFLKKSPVHEYLQSNHVIFDFVFGDLFPIVKVQMSDYINQNNKKKSPVYDQSFTNICRNVIGSDDPRLVTLVQM